MTLGHPVRWLCLIFVTALAIAVALVFVSHHRENVHAPLHERSLAELILKDSRLFEPDGVTPFSGVVFATYDGGELKSRSTVSNGLLHGLSQGWHTNGQQQVEEHFVTGTSHGLRTKWHPNGQKLSEVAIVSGKLQGTFRSWHENGERAEEVELKNGQPDGPSKAYFPSGFLKSQVTLRNGKVVGQKFWKDGEYREATTSGPVQLSGN
jgi:antitoxin component YwqK of YwqJK toxin-antitoxin module